MEGYGLTETTRRRPSTGPSRRGSGPSDSDWPDTAVRIADDGEIWLRGPHVMRRVPQQPGATAQVIDPEGWFHTGDIGALDSDGYLTITGRKKDIIVTAGGKNVAPAVLEDRVQANDLIGYAMVVGEGRPFIGALSRWTRRRWRGPSPTGKLGDDGPALRDDPELRADVAGFHRRRQRCGLKGGVDPEVAVAGPRVQRRVRVT